MTITLHSYIGNFDRALATCAHLLDKGLAHVAEQGLDAKNMLHWRLAPDMHPLAFQLATVANFSASWTARAAGVEVPEGIAWAEIDVAGFKAALATSRDFLATITPEHLAGRDEVPLTVKITDTLEPTLPVERWIASFAETNIQFHTSMIYAILRSNGVPLGKIDMFPTGL